MKFAALVVVYNYDFIQLKQNIDSYITEIDHLYIIDNSDVNLLPQDGFIGAKYSLVQFGNNRGISYALDYGCKRAFDEGYSWVFTFDQDSKVGKDYIDRMVAYVLQTSTSFADETGLIAPLVDLQTLNAKMKTNIEIEVVNVAMTSGCLLNLSIYNQLDGFRKELFIDWVDNDYCYQLKLRKYVIVRLNKCVLLHHLGDCKEYRLFGKHLFYITHHSYIRYYYKTRNALYLSFKYANKLPKESLMLVKSIFVDFIKILFFENSKGRKVRFIVLGLVDFYSRRMGKCNCQ